MNTPRKPKSRQSLIKQRLQKPFIGREAQIESFRVNLKQCPEDWCFLFNIWGQSGVGKSTLVRQLRKIAEDVNFVTAYTNHSQDSILNVMGQYAESFEKQGKKLHQFSERYKIYLQKNEELEADLEAPQGFSAFLGKSITKAGFGLAKQVPASGSVTPFLDEDAIATQAGEWSSYVAKKVRNKDEVRLILKPIEVLTPLFLQDINEIAETANIILFFDTYERTSSFLDTWLREILLDPEEHYGTLPDNLILVIAGIKELSRSDWGDYEEIITRWYLEPFTDDEVKQYLARKGINTPQIVDEILRLSVGLPLWVETLATENSDGIILDNASSSTAVELFLKRVEDPKRQRIALEASISPVLNRDIIAVIHGEESADELFRWLISMPFVEERPEGGWSYHDIIRTQMLRKQRAVSPKDWIKLHGKLSNYYDNLCASLQSENWMSGNDIQLDKFSPKSQQERRDVLQSEWSLRNKKLKQLRNACAIETDTARSFQLQEQIHSEEIILKKLTGELEEIEQALCNYEDYSTSQRYLKHQQWHNSSWQIYFLSSLYHRICQNPKHSLSKAISAFLAALDRQSLSVSAQKCAEIIVSAGEAIALSEIQLLGNQLLDGLKSFNENKYEDGIEMLTLLLTQYRLEEESKVIALSWRGEAYRLMGRYDDSLQNFNDALHINASDIWILVSRSSTYRKIRRYQESLHDCDRAIKIDSKDIRAFTSRGETYLRMKRYEEALRDFDYAIKLDPNDSWSISSRGIAYQQMRLYEEALRDFDYAIKLDPSNPLILSNRGFIHRKQGRYEKALEDYNSGIEIDSNNVRLFASRAETYRLMKQYRKALKDFERAIQLKYNDAWVLSRRAETYLLLKEHDKSLADFEQVIVLSPNNDWRLFTYSLALKASGYIDEASVQINLAIQIAQKRYEKNLEDYRTVLTLILYHLADDNAQTAETLCDRVLAKSILPVLIWDTIRGLDDFLEVFPNNQSGQSMRAKLLKQVESRP